VTVDADMVCNAVGFGHDMVYLAKIQYVGEQTLDPGEDGAIFTYVSADSKKMDLEWFDKYKEANEFELKWLIPACTLQEFVTRQWGDKAWKDIEALTSEE
jgi:hypothetical protein